MRSRGRAARRAAGAVCAVVSCSLVGAAPPAIAADACPNAEVRAQQHASALADCRAYEQMSPVDKNGSGVTLPGVALQWNSAPMLLALDGTAGTFAARSPYAGSQTGGPTSFVARRAPDGWRTDPLELQRPPGAHLAWLLGEIPMMVSTGFSNGRTFFNRVVNSDPTDFSTDQRTPQLIELDAGGSERLVSVGSLGQISPTPNQNGGYDQHALFFDGTSADAAHVVFSTDVALEPGVGTLDQGANELYERLPDQGVTRVVGKLPDGSVPSSGAVLGAGIHFAFPNSDNTNWSQESRHAISADGSQILFEARPSSGAPRELYARIDGDRTVQISAPAAGGGSGPTNDALYEDAAVDGSTVLFLSDAQLTADDRDSSVDLYRFTFNAGRTGGTLTRISGGVGASTLQEIGLVGASQDGGRSYFVSTAALDPDHGTAGSPNLYMSDPTGHLTFLGTLDPSDRDEVAPVDGILQAVYDSPQSRVTPDGSTLVLQSLAQLTDTPTGGHAEIYRYAAGSGFTCVSCRRIAGAIDGEASLTDPRLTPMQDLPRNLSDDGRTVLFQSTDALVPGDANKLQDVYEWRDGRLSLVSSGTSTAAATFVNASADDAKRDIELISTATLAPQDTDRHEDLYDARSGGGFLAPTASAPCDPDCQGPAAPAPGASAIATDGVAGSGNLRPSGTASPGGFTVAAIGKAALTRLARTGALTIAVRTQAKATLSARLTVAHGSRWVSASSTSRSADRPEALHLHLRLGAGERRRLRRLHTLRLRVEIRSSAITTVRHVALTLRAGKGAARHA